MITFYWEFTVQMELLLPFDPPRNMFSDTFEAVDLENQVLIINI